MRNAIYLKKNIFSWVNLLRFFHHINSLVNPFRTLMVHRQSALFSMRRKCAACKAALRHHRITAPLFSGILRLGFGERRRGRRGGEWEEYTVCLSFAGYIHLRTLLCVDILAVTEGDRNFFRTDPRTLAQVFAILRFAWRVSEREREREREREGGTGGGGVTLLLLCVLQLENKAWGAGAGGSASPLLLWV